GRGARGAEPPRAAGDAEPAAPPDLLPTLQCSHGGGRRARRDPLRFGPTPAGPDGDQTARTPSPPRSRGAGSRPRGPHAPTAPATRGTSGGLPPPRPGMSGWGAAQQAGP